MVLGDCISSPPAIAQAVFETIESGAKALPAGRGGSSTNDLYSLGVTILALIGHVPMAKRMNKSSEKLTHGSYNALVGRERLS